MNDQFTCRERVSGTADCRFIPFGSTNRNSQVRFRSIHRHLKELTPDLLVTYNWGAIEWGLTNRFFHRLTHLHMESGFGPEEIDRELRRRILVRRIALAKAERVVVPSLGLVQRAAKGWKVPAERVCYIPNGVDSDRFAASPDLSLRPAGWADAIIVGTVAPMRPEKNLSLLMNAFSRLSVSRRVCLLMVGDGPERSSLEREAQTLGLADRVHFTGNTQSPETAFGLLDVFVMSSDTEQMPNALIQAMAACRSVAATDVGDIAEIVSPENRPYIVPARDCEALATALGHLVEDGELRRTIGCANRSRVKARYELDTMIEAYRQLFDGGQNAAAA